MFMYLVIFVGKLTLFLILQVTGILKEIDNFIRSMAPSFFPSKICYILFLKVHIFRYLFHILCRTGTF